MISTNKKVGTLCHDYKEEIEYTSEKRQNRLSFYLFVSNYRKNKRSNFIQAARLTRLANNKNLAWSDQRASNDRMMTVTMTTTLTMISSATPATMMATTPVRTIVTTNKKDLSCSQLSQESATPWHTNIHTSSSAKPVMIWVPQYNCFSSLVSATCATMGMIGSAHDQLSPGQQGPTLLPVCVFMETVSLLMSERNCNPKTIYICVIWPCPLRVLDLMDSSFSCLLFIYLVIFWKKGCGCVCVTTLSC